MTAKATTAKPLLTIDQILAWADQHQTATGSWPKKETGQVQGTDETWAGINAALRRGGRGLPGSSTLARLLAERRAVRNIKRRPPLTIEQILDWADSHKAATRTWPSQESGQVRGTDETWAGINAALSRGGRGLPGDSTLARLLAERRAVRNIKGRPLLTIEQILTWADAHRARTGTWPKKDFGQVGGTDETWAGINAALARGRRGLPGGSTLAKLLAEHRGVRNIMDLPDLSIEQVLTWADAYKAPTGRWPKKESGQVADTGETWLGINATLRGGGRSLPGGSSLAKLLAERRR